jgi:FlaA1/EpsC-like NDP-sugar epimerase
MIRLTGLEVRDEAHPDGDVAIAYTGPRDGEKLYEELLLGANISPTEHPRIMRSREPYLPRPVLDALLAELRAGMAAGSVAEIRATLGRAVEDYRPGRSEEPRAAA